MKVLYDHQIFTSQKYGGISRYFYELIKEFDNVKGVQTKTALVLSNNHYISDQHYIKHIAFFPNKVFRGKQHLIMLANKINSVFQIKKQNYDIFHPTYYDPYFLQYIGNKPFVLTVHDMTHEKFSEFFPTHDITTKNKKILVEKASKIIAISESTKKDLIEIFDVKPSKIEVLYHANSMVLDDNSSLVVGVPTKYILFVGQRSGYKNFDTFIRAAATVLNENTELSVACVGGGRFKTEELSLLSKLKIQDRVFQYDGDDESLAQFYKKAVMFIFPSLYEGFGIPVLEAFACKCPLVCSNTSSLPEIAGNGAEYFDPYSEKSIYQAIKNVLDNSNYRKLLISNGSERLKNFSWKQTAIDTKKVYESILTSQS